MELNQPAHYRARMAALYHVQKQIRADLTSASPTQKKVLEPLLAQARAGVFPEGFNSDEMVLLMEKRQTFSKEPLTTAELLTLNTFFEIHPQKICGYQVPTSARYFPFTIKGTREEVEAAIDTTLAILKPSNLEALALELEHNLLHL